MASKKYEKKILKELQQLRQEVEELKKEKKTRTTLPDGLQSAVRQVVRKLTQDEERPLLIDYESFQNNDIQLVVTEVKRAYREYHWGSSSIEAAFKKVWRNIRDDKRRRDLGKIQQHRMQSKNAKRIKDKLRSRRTQLERDHDDGVYDDSSARAIGRALIPDATSPEKTDDEDSTRRVSIPLRWESDRLTEVKRDLDLAYRESLTRKARRLRATVNKSATETTDSEPPACLPRWAVKEETRATETS